jgi:hypothetical protein
VIYTCAQKDNHILRNVFMKHVPLFSVVIIVSIFGTGLAMEEEIPLKPLYRTLHEIASSKTNNKSLEEQFNDFEKRLREKYDGGGGILRYFKTITLTAPDVIKECESLFPIILTSEELIKQFAQNEDSYFSKAIDMVIRIGSWNIKKVTCDILADIENPQAQQPQELLNAIPFVLKKYVMDFAYQDICNINPQDASCLYDLHAARDLMAAVNTSGALQLWDLKTKKVLHNFPEIVYPREVKFSNDGSYLVTVDGGQLDSDSLSIKIWDLCFGEELSLKLLHTINKPGPIKSLDLCCRWGRERILTILSSDSVELHSWRQDEKLTLLSHIPIPTLEPNFHNAHVGDYTYEHNEKMGISKNNYRSFYLCRLALSQTTNASSVPKIKDAPAYKRLTIYEREKIDWQLQKRIGELKVFFQ